MSTGKLWLMATVFTILAVIFVAKIMQNMPPEESCHISVAEFRDLQESVKQLQKDVVSLQTTTNLDFDQSYIVATNDMGWMIEVLKWDWVHGNTNEWGWGAGYDWRHPRRISTGRRY